LFPIKYFLEEIVRRIVKIIFSVLTVLIILYTVINLWDAKLNPDAYTLDDLNDASFERANGFYILWGLSEPAGVDVQSEEYTLKIRKFFDPEYENDDYIKGFDHRKYLDNFKAYRATLDKINYPRPSMSYKEDWITTLSSQADKIEKARQEAAGPLGRYRRLIQTPKFEDFSFPRIDAPIPNLPAWLRVAKLYTAICTTEAVNGTWEESVTNILDQLDFAKKVNASTRVLILNAVAKGIMKFSLQALVSILNHPQCPESVYPMVLLRMPPLKYEEYGNRNPFIFECLTCIELVDSLYKADKTRKDIVHVPRFLPSFLLLQKNRTKNYFYTFYSALIAYDEQEPYLWKKNPFKEDEAAEIRVKRAFWWLRNPVGKILAAVMIPNIGRLIYSGNQIRAYYDMTRISAELHLKYSAERNVMDILEELDSYKTQDPCSGKPYAWNKKKGVLYSIGTDRVDNEGTDNPNTMTDTDFVIPVVLRQKL
jgi:hypothetical protein